MLDTLRTLLSAITREVASVRPECGNCVGNSDSGISQDQDCDAGSEASSVKYSLSAGISPTERNDTPNTVDQEGVRPSDGNINGHLEDGISQNQESNEASSVKCNPSSGVRPIRTDNTQEQDAQHIEYRITRKRRKAKSKASRKQLAALEPQIDVHTISGEAFRRMKRQKHQICLLYVKP